MSSTSSTVVALAAALGRAERRVGQDLALVLGFAEAFDIADHAGDLLLGHQRSVQPHQIGAARRQEEHVAAAEEVLGAH